MRENCFPGLESFVRTCPKEVDEFLPQILTVAQSFMRYDPNYSYNDDDGDGEGSMLLAAAESEDSDSDDVAFDDDDGDDYGGDEFGGASDDDDT